MTEEQLTIAANSVCGLADVLDVTVEDILDALVFADTIDEGTRSAIINRIADV